MLFAELSRKNPLGMSGAAIGQFTDTYLLQNLDSPKPIPDFHLSLWDYCCRDDVQVALVCPRGHGKTTAITEIYTLYSIFSRNKQYAIIISDTLDQAKLFLSGIKALIDQNKQLQEDYGFAGWIKDGIEEVQGVFTNGEQFCITAMGRGQAIRGRLWRNNRPDLITCDDIEDEKSVESDDMREGTRTWLYRAVLPALADEGCIRVVGTILHLDALLYRFNKDPEWEGALWKAHDSFNNFDNILWPEKFSEKRLRKIQASYTAAGRPDYYAIEYLNDPIDQSEAYFTDDDFLAMDDTDYMLPMEYYAGVDLAISDDDRAAYTVFVIAGLASNGLLYIRNVLRYRSNDSTIHVNNMLDLQTRYNVALWKIEKGQIEMSMKGYLYREMIDQGIGLNIDTGSIPRDNKRARARSIQGLMRSGRVRWDMKSAWYDDCKIELLQFPKGAYKDQVDALAWLGIMIADLNPALSTEDLLKQQREEDIQRYDMESTYFGADPDTGY